MPKVTCEDCGKKFKTNNGLNGHKAWCKGNSFVAAIKRGEEQTLADANAASTPPSFSHMHFHPLPTFDGSENGVEESEVEEVVYEHNHDHSHEHSSVEVTVTPSDETLNLVNAIDCLEVLTVEQLLIVDKVCASLIKRAL